MHNQLRERNKKINKKGKTGRPKLGRPGRTNWPSQLGQARPHAPSLPSFLFPWRAPPTESLVPNLRTPHSPTTHAHRRGHAQAPATSPPLSPHSPPRSPSLAETAPIKPASPFYNSPSSPPQSRPQAAQIPRRSRRSAAASIRRPPPPRAGPVRTPEILTVLIGDGEVGELRWLGSTHLRHGKVNRQGK
jgi:hypothetical protein